jgi:hypothetical protein
MIETLTGAQHNAVLDVAGALEHAPAAAAVFRASGLSPDEVLHDYNAFLDCMALASQVRATCWCFCTDVHARTRRTCPSRGRRWALRWRISHRHRST